MKQSIIYLLLLSLPISLCSQTKITMTFDRGYYTIPCKINGLTTRCIYDANAASLISISDAIYMAKNGYLSENDVIDYASPKTLKENSEVIIREIEIGGLKLRNVKARAVRDMIVPLMIGQTAIQQLGYVQMSGDELLISSYSASKQKQNTYQQPKQQQQAYSTQQSQNLPSYQSTYPIQNQQQTYQQPIREQQFVQPSASQQQAYQQLTQKNTYQSQQQTCPVQPQKATQTLIVYIDDEVELAFNDNIQCDANNSNICQVWVRREYFGDYKDKYISSFTKANLRYLEAQQKSNKNFDAASQHVNYTNFKYNWALYSFDFSQQRYKMTNLIQYDQNDRIIQTSDKVKSEWEEFKPDSRMKVVYDAVAGYRRP